MQKVFYLRGAPKASGTLRVYIQYLTYSYYCLQRVTRRGRAEWRRTISGRGTRTHLTLFFIQFMHLHLGGRRGREESGWDEERKRESWGFLSPGCFPKQNWGENWMERRKQRERARESGSGWEELGLRKQFLPFSLSLSLAWHITCPARLSASYVHVHVHVPILKFLP